MWNLFLSSPELTFRKFFEFNSRRTTLDLEWYTDASSTLGCGGYNDSNWFIGEWDSSFNKKHKVSINYLKLFAVVVGVRNWIHKIQRPK